MAFLLPAMRRRGSAISGSSNRLPDIGDACGPVAREFIEGQAHTQVHHHGLHGSASRVYEYALANRGHDTRALQAYLGHRNIQHTVRYAELSPTRFKDFWRV